MPLSLALEIAGAEYLPTTGSVAALGVSPPPGTKSAVKLALKTVGQIPFDQIALDRLTLFLRGSDELPMRIYEQLISDTLGMVVRSAGKADDRQHRVDVDQADARHPPQHKRDQQDQGAGPAQDSNEQPLARPR